MTRSFENHMTVSAWILALLLLPAAALAEEPVDDGPDFGRPGVYLGLNYAHGFGQFYEDVIEDETGIPTNVKDADGLNARVGYRLASWFALEANYEWMNGFKAGIVGVDVFEQTTHTITGNLKFIVPTWRIQPYLMLGVGGQYYRIQDQLVGVINGKDWIFAGRPAIGLDFYLTQHLVLNAEASGVIAVSDFSGQLQSVETAPYVSLGAGIQWRF